MGLLRNLRLLASESVLTRMVELEQRMDLLEDYTEQKLDSMKVYSRRVAKRERDAESDERATGKVTALRTGHSGLLERLERRRALRAR